MPLPSWRQNNKRGGSKEETIKGFVIAGTGSNSGKTTASLGIMAFLASLGYRVAPFKIGPDFIDPGHHRALTGRTSRNLDSWMLSRQYNQKLFAAETEDADIAVVEGVMGLFDGYSGVCEAGSTAQMAKWLNLPVVLMVDARSMARSAAAVVQGFENFDPDLIFAGVIFNKTGSAGHYQYLKEAVQETCRTPPLGFFPRNDTITLPERHLGLVTPEEHRISGDTTAALTAMVRENTAVREMVEALPPLAVQPEPDPSPKSENRPGKPVVAVARDKAFCFYYQDNIEFLEKAGAEIAFFSPLEDATLPPNTHGIYLGGGYPELFAGRLSGNTTLLGQIKEKSDLGMPVYGECGGFMYLCADMTGMDGRATFPMTGCFPFSIEMSPKMRSLGYREITLARETVIGSRGDVLRGHEFHYSSIRGSAFQEEQPDRNPGLLEDVYTVTRRDGRNTPVKGYETANTLGSYLHIHFGSSPKAAEKFVQKAQWFKTQ
ncbi:MAG TPA: cobyrinate a,c-diamide synthase [Desulfobacteraceae bacterium]|nr:cobyrinate a,c-diamide synthase [Desulfobacteraceae bacterium]